MPTRKNKDITRIVNRVNKSSADFVNRLKDPNRLTIPDWEDSRYIATHKLGVGTDDNGQVFIFPYVQNIDGKLIDFSNPKFGKWDGMDSAIERKDTVHVNNIQDGLDFTENYKRYYPTGKSFKYGGRRRKARLGLEEEIPTQEEYIAQQIAAKKAAALDKSRNRTSVKVPMVPNDESEEVWKRTIDDIIRMDEELLSRMMNELGKSSNPYDISRIEKTQKRLDKLLEEKDAGYPKLVPGANCMYNAGDCYGLNIPGNQTFVAKHKELGFKKASKGSMEPGDIVQDVRSGTPIHAMIYDSKDAEGNLLFNYARGNVYSDFENSYVKQGKYSLPIKDYDVYKYVGTPTDSTQWINEYKQRYGNQMKCGGRRKAQLGLDIREGGIAIPIAPNMYYMKGRSHDNGGIAIGPNNKNGLEVEGGEVVKVGKNDIKVFSSVPLLRGVSPAQLVMGGANPNKVFDAQEEFKDRNRINDDGTSYEIGGQKIININDMPSVFRGQKINGRYIQLGIPPITNKAKSWNNTFKDHVNSLNVEMKNFIMDGIKYGKQILPKPLRKYYARGINILNSPGVEGINNTAQKITQIRAITDEKKAGGIYIKPNKRGTFTAAATKHGMGVQEFASKVLANKEDYSPAMVKKANFARNASRWKKEYGGRTKAPFGLESPIKGGYYPESSEPKTIKWLSDWLNGRRAQLYENTASSPSHNFYYSKPFDEIRGLFKGISGNRLQTNRIFYSLINNAASATHKIEDTVSTISSGQYDKKANEITYPNSNIDMNSSIHERTHAMKSKPQTVKIKNILGDRYKQPWGEPDPNSMTAPLVQYMNQYLSDPEEIYSRMMEYRYNSNLKPSDKVDVNQLNKNRELLKNLNLHYMSDEDLMNLFNNVASNKDNKIKAKFGGSMIYTINGNVKNGLSSVRDKAQYGKKRKVDTYGNFITVDDDNYFLNENGIFVPVEKTTINRQPKTVRGASNRRDIAYDRQGNRYQRRSDGSLIRVSPEKGNIATNVNLPELVVTASKPTKKESKVTAETKPNVGETKPYTITGKTENYLTGQRRSANRHPVPDYVGKRPEIDNKKEPVKASTNSTPRKGNTQTKSVSVVDNGPKVTRSPHAYTNYKGETKIAASPYNNVGVLKNITGDSTYDVSQLGSPKYKAAKAKLNTSSTGDGAQAKDGRWVGQYKATNAGDWIGLGANVLGSIGSYLLTKSAINKMPEPIKPALYQAAKLKTKYNIEPQLSEIREAEQMNRASVRRNTQSSNTSLAREQRLLNEARTSRNKLYGQKENIETQLINQDRLNRQSVRMDNVRAYNNYLNNLIDTRKTQNQLGISNVNNLIYGLTGSVNNILSNIESRKATNNTIRAIAAANPNVDARLIGGFDYYIDPITKKKYNKNQQYVGTINS